MTRSRQSVNPKVQCADCRAEGITTVRDVYPGAAKGRCQTHHRAFRKRQKEAQAGKLREQRYGLTPDQFSALWNAQGHLCAICRKPIKVRRPQVDHDHETGLVRGLICRRCNRELLPHYTRDDLIRALEYVANPPAFEVIGRIKVPLTVEELKR